MPFDAFIFCDVPPVFSYDDGLFHVAGKSGGLVFNLYYKPHDFLAAVALASEAVAKWRYDQVEKVVAIR